MAFSIDPAVKKAFFEDGTVKIPKFLDADMLAQAQALFDWSLANPGPSGAPFRDGENVYRGDLFNPEAMDVYRETVAALPLAKLLKEMWDSEHVWYGHEELFYKKGHAPATHWHQDAPTYIPILGDHFAGCWICFDACPAGYAIDVVRGSHRGIVWDGNDLEDPTQPFWGEHANLPPLPDIEASTVLWEVQRADPNSWDVVSYAVEPGDVVLLHPGCLHRGGPVDETCRERRTLILRFFGDDAKWGELPGSRDVLSDFHKKYVMPASVGQEKVGAAFRGERYPQLF